MAKRNTGAPKKGLLRGAGGGAPSRSRGRRRMLSLVSCTVASLTTVFGLGPIALQDLATSPAAAQPSCTASTSGEAQLNEASFTATSTPSSSSGAQNAINNAVNHTNPSRFTSGADQASGDTFEVNMGSAQTFNEIEMTAPDYITDYARGFNVNVSSNGTSWSTVESCTGTATPEIVSFANQTDQYLEVVLTASSTSNWWSVEEFLIFNGTTTTTTAATTTTTAATTTTKATTTTTAATTTTKATTTTTKATTTTTAAAANCSASTSGETQLNEAGFTATAPTPASSSGAQDPITNAVNDNTSAGRFTSGADEAAGDDYVVNMGSAETFNEIEMASPDYSSDYAYGYEVEVGPNGSTWTVVATCTGSGTPEVVSFPSQTDQYLEVVLTTANSANWWSVEQFRVYNGTATTTTGPTTTAATTTTTKATTTTAATTTTTAATTTTKATTTTTAATTTTVVGASCLASTSGEAALSETAFTATSESASTGVQDPVTNAVNGNTSAGRFTTDADQGVGDYYELNMGSAHTFNEIELNAPDYATDYARGYNVLAGANGTSWTTLATCTGTANPEVVSFAPTTDQYIEVVLTASSTTTWWSIEQFYVLNSSVTTTTTTTPSTTTTVTAPGQTTTTPEPNTCDVPTTSPDPQSGDYLMSLNRPAFASSVEAGSGDYPDNVDNGSLCTAWQSTWDVDPSWVYVDLGDTANITQVVIYWDSAYATSFELQTSPDQLNWTTIYTNSAASGGTEVINITASARYLRVYGESRYFSQYGYQIAQLQVFGTGGENAPPNTQPDLALNEPVTASSEDTVDNLASTMEYPANVTDGNTSTCWTSSYGDDQWISVNLGAVKQIGEVSFNWYWPAEYARAYDIQVSNDGENWTTVYRQLYGDGGTNGTGGEYGGTESIPLDVSGQYVRMYEYARQQNGGNSSLVMCEFDVYSWVTGDPTPSYSIPPIPVPGVATAGSGSYSTNDVTQLAPYAPKYVTSNITGPIKSNTWWTSLLIDPLGDGYSLVPLPLKAYYSAQGLGIYNPGAGYAAADGGSVNANDPPDLYIDSNAVVNTENEETLVNAYGPWDVNVYFTDNGTPEMSSTLVEGSPFVYNTFSNPSSAYIQSFNVTNITNPSGTSVLANNGATYTGDHIGLTIVNTDYSGSGTQYTKYYGVFVPAGTVFTRIGSAIFMDFGSGGNYMSVATMPSLSDLSYFYTYAYAFVTGTSYSYNYNDTTGKVTTTYTDATTLEYPGMSSSTLMGLEPHQWQTTSAALTTMDYPSVRGNIELYQGNSFSTTDTFTGLVPEWAEPSLTSGYSRATVLSYLHSLTNWLGASPSGWLGNFADPYWEGKILQPTMMGAMVASQIGDTADKNFYLNVLQYVFDNFLTYSCSDPEHDNYFYYNSQWGALFPFTSDFGDNVDLDDAHLTYGYWVYAAAILAYFDPTWATQYGPMVDLIIDNYADPNADDGMFPQFRNFDVYAGHSWAGGYADNPSGANQESSSEAMQSWAAEYLWGLVTNNSSYLQAGAWGFTTESRAVEDYYFNYGGVDFLAGYTGGAAGQIYGSSYWFGTYFGAQPYYVYGIQWLPTAPWLAYYGVNQTDAADLWQDFVTANGGVGTTWQHITVPFDAISDPTDAITQFNNTVSTMETDAIFNTYWFVYNMASYGHEVTNIWANWGGTQVLYNGSTYTAEVFNPTSKEITVDFYETSGQVGSVDVGPDLTITTNPLQSLAPDTSAPTTPTGLTATAASTTSTTLTWTASTDNEKVQQYVVYRNGTEVGTTPQTTYTDSGLTPLTSYSYYVVAEDAAGNLSGDSSTGSATTPGVETTLNEASFVASTNAPSATDGEGDVPQNAIRNAVSGNAGSPTRFSSDTDQVPGLYFEVNMGSAQTFNQIEMNSTGGYAGDYAPSYNVEVSANGTSWTTVATSTGNTAFPEVTTFPAQTDQYLEVVLEGTTGTWWSVVQFFVNNLTSGPTYPPDLYTLNVWGSDNTSGLGSCVPEGALNESGWTASSNAAYGTDVPQNAITNEQEGTNTTHFSTDQDQQPGLYFEANMGSEQTFNEVDMDSGGSIGDYARAYTVEDSTNGTTWTMVTTGVGAQTPEVVPFPTQTAQYIKVVLDEASTTNWWTIAVFTVYNQVPGWTASTNTSGSPQDAIDGTPDAGWTTTGDQATGNYFEVNMGQPWYFDTIEMDSTNNPNDYARDFEVQVSSNGTSWTTIDASGVGEGQVESVSFPTQVEQYVRVTVTASAGEPWSIGQFRLQFIGFP